MIDSGLVVDRIAVALGWDGSISPELEWEVAEEQLGTPFPADYKEFMGRFPSGVVRDVITFWNPVQSAEHLAQCKARFDGILVCARIAWERGYDSFPPFPESNGVIPFASDVEGGALFWLPWTSNPDKWHVVYQSRHSPDDWTRTKRSMASVMLELATSRSERNILGWDLSAKDRSFRLLNLPAGA
ncbi:SMI1/KNR4 family protein [Amycolatopsis regifaucium]|uniref:Knr4/Smi1-like domain-containing protein n=1 Tax=Amycolatopsis regifaucium TaxID=546365 RepID=A0ABX3DHC6_9PSEU|nr:SMI1/KNR4 family protein [Amycolatopsis regifaucium]OKA03876.1 hypothetical protein ATP06_0233995 [Amycolatopsis regifaucium]